MLDSECQSLKCNGQPSATDYAKWLAAYSAGTVPTGASLGTCAVSSNTIGMIIGIVVGAVAFIGIVAGVVWYRRKKAKEALIQYQAMHAMNANMGR